MDQQKLKKILGKHSQWLRGEKGGESANLYGANLFGANLYRTKMREVKWNMNTGFCPMQCPQKGAYIEFKKAGGLIVELEITADALRSSATTRKCRASKAKVLSITDVEGKDAGTDAASDHDESFIYRVGEIVEVDNFDKNRWNECSTGIHHFITREEAVRY